MLKGSLDDFTLSDIFRLLSFTKKTGKLEVKRSAGEGNVFFRDGDVYFAQSSLKKEPLGQKLIRTGALSEPQLLRALDLHASTGQRVGEILLEQGAITQEQLVNAVAEQIEDAAFDLLRWELGEFLFESHERFDVEIPISVSVENLIMEASRRLDELEVIRRKIPSADVVLAVAAAPPDGARQINISPDEWRLLVLVDGVRTVGEICEAAGLDDFAGVRTLYGMISTGLLDIAEMGPAESDDVMLTPPSPVDARIQGEDGEPEAEAVSDDPVSIEPEPVAEEAVDVEGEDDEPTIVRAPDEPAIDEAYEAIPENLADMFSDEDVEDGEDESESQDDGDVAVAEESFEYETDTDVLNAEPNDEQEVDAGLEFPEEVESAAVADEFGDTPLEEFLTPEPDAPRAEDQVVEPDLSDVIASGVPDEWFEDPQPQAPAPPAPVAADPDPFLDDILNGDLASTLRREDYPEETDASGPQVDRAAVVRELAGLFNDEEQPVRRVRASGGEDVDDADTSPTGAAKRRVEDDDQINKGLIGRFIDGVKGM
jgi:Domain of unknown function (DUF4388)